MRVEIIKLNALAEDLDKYKNDISGLSEDILKTTENLLKRVENVPDFAIRTICRKAEADTEKALLKISDIENSINYEVGCLKNAAVLYKKKDTIDTVN